MQFKLCTVQFQSLGQEFSALYSTLFDADPATLEYITLYPILYLALYNIHDATVKGQTSNLYQVNIAISNYTQAYV